MKELIKYLAAILNIKTDSELVVLDIENELTGIADIADYRKFVRDNFNYLGTDFMTGFQKFIKLTKAYKEKVAKENSAGRLEDGYQFARSLAAKVRSTTSYVLDNNYLECDNFINEGKSIFSEFEQKELKKIGSLLSCVNMQRSVSGEDALFDRLKSQMEKIVISKALGHTPAPSTDRSVSALISTTVNKIKV